MKAHRLELGATFTTKEASSELLACGRGVSSQGQQAAGRENGAPSMYRPRTGKLG